MTHHNPISLSVEDLNNIDLSAEDLNNIDLSAEDAHKITLSVIDWFYTQILNAIVAQAAVKLGATALCSVLSKINAESAVVLGASGSLKAPARIIGSAGMGLGASAELDAGGVVLWTPAQLDSSVCKLWLDANDSSTITKDGSNYVSQWNDKSGNNNHVYQETGNLQPLYSSASSLAGNKPAIVNPDTDTGTKLNANVEFTLREIYFVCAYKDGLDNTFDNYDALLSGTNSDWGKPRICGDMGKANLRNDDSKFTSDVYINGNNTLTSTVLSMPLCIIRGVSGSSKTSKWSIGGNRKYADARNWKGIICEVIGFPSSLTADEARKIEGYLAHKWELTAKLPVDHPYKSNPPTV